MAKNVYRQGKKAVSISASGAINLRIGPVRITGSKLEVKMESGRAIFPLRGVQLSPPMTNDSLPGGGARLFARNVRSGLEITVNFVVPEEGPWIGLGVQVRNLQSAVVSLQRITLLRAPLRKIAPIGSAPRPYMLLESDHTGGAAGVRTIFGEPSGDEVQGEESRNFTAFFVPGGDCLFAGCLMSGKALSRLGLDRDHVFVTAEFNCEIPSYGCVETDLLVLSGGVPLGDAQERFGALHRGRRRGIEAAGYHAWTSDDWHAKDLVESDIMDTLVFLKETPWLRESIHYVIVGRGWQRALGEWEPQERFPSLMDTLAARIADAGFIPGIWIAPLAVSPKSVFAEKHPDWVLRRADKQEPEIGQLDYTLPAVRDHAYAAMRRLYDWGYRYFTTDFAGCEIEPGAYKFRGRTESVRQSFRSVVLAIRAAIGEDSFWHVTHAPIGPVVGLCDALSVAPPARPYFATLLGCARSGMFRAYQHGIMWLNDPGLLVVRGPQTAQPEGLRPGDNAGGPYERYGWEKGPMLKRHEARLWATWIVMSGGQVTLGDRIATLSAEGLAIIRKALPRAGNTPAVPLDLGVVPLPRIWQRIDDRSVNLALFNWSDEEAEIVVSPHQGARLPASGEIFEVWSEETVKLQGETLKRRLPAHSVELYEWDL